ncbi:DUF4294 domain-containing protein [Polluticoccus soli]|uniref:DUF4294 domain-containing protein n=1 Tax=Polluticoccus soli TaxID=3034150 RepID=UPI0023E26782|nr:DUF4294 domain-containing protein [Flavipsychrobacter sp. JY13-12]
MKGIVSLGALVTILSCSSAQAQDANAPDTLLMVKLPTVNVNAERKWANDTVRYQYNQTRYYITTILPYLNAATKLFNELDAKVNDPNTNRKERKAFVSSKEDELRDKFENEVKNLNETQGVLLVKLVARQTGVNIYSMLGEFKNPFTAVKWQAWARFNGFNLNKRYTPADEPMLEHIMEDLGYPLPAVYGEMERTALRNQDVKYPKR